MATVTTETLFVPRLFVVKNATFGQRLAALRTALGMQILITVGAVKFTIFWHKTAGPNGLLTNGAFEALLMPVRSIVFEACAP